MIRNKSGTTDLDAVVAPGIAKRWDYISKIKGESTRSDAEPRAGKGMIRPGAYPKWPGTA